VLFLGNVSVQVDIHPTEDPNSMRGDTFMIGIRCQKEQVGNFEVSVNCAAPAPHQVLHLQEGIWDIVLRRDAYSYFRIPVDSSHIGKVSEWANRAAAAAAAAVVIPTEPNFCCASCLLLVCEQLVLTVTPCLASSPPPSLPADVLTVEQQFGRGIYATDSLVSSGLFSRDQSAPTEGRAPTLAEAIATQV
jgi:hypothetical protein